MFHSFLAPPPQISESGSRVQAEREGGGGKEGRTGAASRRNKVGGNRQTHAQDELTLFKLTGRRRWKWVL